MAADEGMLSSPSIWENDAQAGSSGQGRHREMGEGPEEMTKAI